MPNECIALRFISVSVFDVRAVSAEYALSLFVILLVLFICPIFVFTIQVRSLIAFLHSIPFICKHVVHATPNNNNK